MPRYRLERLNRIKGIHNTVDLEFENITQAQDHAVTILKSASTNLDSIKVMNLRNNIVTFVTREDGIPHHVHTGYTFL